MHRPEQPGFELSQDQHGSRLIGLKIGTAGKSAATRQGILVLKIADLCACVLQDTQAEIF